MGTINSPGRAKDSKDCELVQIVPGTTKSSLKITNHATTYKNRFRPYKIYKRLYNAFEQDMVYFLTLIETSCIQTFLLNDPCLLISDQYLLATTFLYLRKCGFVDKKDYNIQNFFVALYIANEIEEDEENYKYEIFPWVLGKKWNKQFALFFQWRDSMLIDLKFNLIGDNSCDEIMNIIPNHWIWDRERKIHHSGTRLIKAQEDSFFQGPNSSPKIACELCTNNLETNRTAKNDATWSPKFDF